MDRMHLRIWLVAASALYSTMACAADRTALTATQMTSQAAENGLVDNSAFVPPPNSAPAHEEFSGTLIFDEALMVTEPSKFKKDSVLGKNPQIFPDVSLAFVSSGGDLIPITQDVLRNGTLQRGHSFWDVIVQPGKVWSEPDDNGWSRASFPFALMNSIEGETHNGVATFLYKDGAVSNVRYQIVQQTSPFYVEDYFTASGSLHATYKAEKVADAAAIIARFEASERDAEKIHPWSELEARVGKDKLAGFDSVIRPTEVVLDGISVGDDFYLKSCPAAGGQLPYCERQRFGVWSITKSASNAMAMLRISQKYGKDIFARKIADYVPEARNVPGWQEVTFGDALNMATGVGYGSTQSDPNSISEPYGDAYYGWYEGRTVKDKVDALLKGAKPYPWGPGKVARYRDEDMFILGVALTSYLKTKEGADANVWSFLEKEIYEPLGIHYAPTNKTIESDVKDDQPLMAYGFYPTISDLVKISRLYQHGGKLGDVQLLDPELLADVMPSKMLVGLPTGDEEKPIYHKGFWHAELKSANGCTFSYPIMDGWGESYIMMMPKDITLFRLAKNWDGDKGAGNLENMTAVADKLADFCH